MSDDFVIGDEDLVQQPDDHLVADVNSLLGKLMSFDLIVTPNGEIIDPLVEMGVLRPDQHRGIPEGHRDRDPSVGVFQQRTAVFSRSLDDPPEAYKRFEYLGDGWVSPHLPPRYWGVIPEQFPLEMYMKRHLDAQLRRGSVFRPVQVHRHSGSYRFEFPHSPELD